MATATAQRRDVKEFTFVWEGVRSQQPPGARRDARGLRDGGHDQPAPAGHPRHQGQEAVVPRRAPRRRKGSDVLHAPARDHAAGRRAAPAGVRHRRPRPQQRAVLAAHDGHQGPHRGGLEPVAGVPRAPGPVRPPLLQSRERRRDLRHARRDPRPARDLQGKDPRHQGQDQVGAVLPDLGHHRRDRRGLGHHGLGHPGVQAGVHELRRRPAGADADRDGHLRLLRQSGGG